MALSSRRHGNDARMILGIAGVATILLIGFAGYLSWEIRRRAAQAARIHISDFRPARPHLRRAAGPYIWGRSRLWSPLITMAAQRRERSSRIKHLLNALTGHGCINIATGREGARRRELDSRDN